MDVFEYLEERKKNIKKDKATKLKNLKEAKELIKSHDKFFIIGDYDADGICATTESFFILKDLGKEVNVRFPRRVTEGYGLSMKIVDEIIENVSKDTLICTVDNGIAAYDEIAKLKENGYKVLLTDHHLVPIKDKKPHYPPADVIINESDGINNGNTPWCGAGLIYALMTQTEAPVSHQIHNTVTLLAGLATVADLVPLINGNRRLVQESLKIANNMEYLTVGVMALLKFIKSEEIDEYTYGFVLGPMINASGRLYDDGAKGVFDILTCDDIQRALGNVKILGDINQKRKELSFSFTEKAKSVLEVGRSAVPAIDAPSGIRGLVAGQLTEEYNVPSFVFTKSGNVLKGSARSVDDINIFEVIQRVDKNNPGLINRFGGHKAAMGIEIDFDKLDEFREKLDAELPEPKEKEFIGDAQITDDYEKIYKEMKKIAPFGMGNPAPVFELKNYKTQNIYNNYKYTLLGAHKEHIKFTNGNITALGFSKANEFLKQGSPEVMNLLVTPMMNTFRCKKEIQLDIVALKRA